MTRIINAFLIFCIFVMFAVVIYAILSILEWAFGVYGFMILPIIIVFLVCYKLAGSL